MKMPLSAGAVSIEKAKPPSGFSEQSVEAHGTRIHYVRGGSGTPLVLIHGWPQTWFEWRLVMPALAERFDVIVPSLRGINGSSGPSIDCSYDARTMATDVWNLLQALGVGPAHVVGHDIGLLVAHAYAATYPEQVSKLVLAEGVLIGLEPMTTEFTRFPRALSFTFNMTPRLPEQLTHGRERIFIDFFFDQASVTPEAITGDARAEYARVYSEPGAMSASFEWYRAFPQNIKYIIGSKAEKLRMPVLGLGGDKTTGNFMAPMIRQIAVDVRNHIFLECGHYFAEEKPAETVEQLLQFLSA